MLYEKEESAWLPFYWRRMEWNIFNHIFGVGSYAFYSSENNPVILMIERETHTGKLYT